MNKKFLKVLFSMSFLLILGKALGFVRTALVASTYGAGFVSDIYSFEDSFINEIYAIFSTFLGCSFIPHYLSLDDKGRNRLFSLLLNWGTIIIIFLTSLCLLFTESFLWLLVPGYFELYDISQIIFITRINLLMLILTFLANYMVIVLQAHEIFIYLSLESVILNAIVILYLFVMPEQGVLGLLLCRMIAYIILIILVIAKLHRVTQLSYKFYIDVKDKDLVDMIRLSLPMLGITVLWQLNFVIDRSMASGLESGSIACLNYANTISMIIYNVIGYIVSTYAYPVLSKVQNNAEKVKEGFREYFLVLLRLILPITILTIFFARYVTNLLYGRGNMSEDSLEVISGILIMYLPGSIAYCIKNLYAKLFYIKQNTRSILLMDVAGCLINISLNLVLVRFIGVYGLALSTSVSYISTVILQFVFANKKEYTDIRMSDFKQSACSLLILIVLGAISSRVLGIVNENIYFGFAFVVTIYIISVLIFSFKDLRNLLIAES